MAGAPVVLDGFFATFSDEPTKPVSLAAIKDEANANRQLIVHGQLVTFPAGGQPVLQPGVVQTPPITDWVIEYSANPSLWVCSQSKWFRLLRPANQYVPVHYEVQRKFDLSVRAMYILRQKQDVGLEKVHQLILNPIPGHYSGTGTYTVSDLQKEAGFVFGQLAVASKRLKLLSSLGMPVLMSGFAQLAPKEVVNEILLQLSDEMSKEGDDSESDEPGAKRQRLSHGGSRGWMDAKRLERERAADLARGAPPAACTDWRVEPHMVTDLLMIWDMCMSFCHLLQLPPITLPQFEAAIMPGPVPLRAVPHAPIPAAPGGRLDDDEDDDDAVGSLFPHHDFLGAGTSLFGPRPAPAPKPVDPDSVTYNLSTLLDADGASAGLILRDLHVALVKVIDGFSIKRLHDPPETSKLPADDNKTELWQEKTWQAVLDSKAPAELIQPGAREAAEMLKKGSEYYQLSSAQRLAVLRTLVDLALNSDVMRDYIEKKTEMAGAKPKGGFNILPPDMEDDRDAENMRSFTAPMLSVAELQDPMTWVRWLDGCRPTTGGGSQWTLPPYFAPRLSKARIGVRRPLGVDVRQRRYWAFGGRAGCWRIFVESVHGGGWGWYEGASLQALISWLQTGAVEREVPLLRALEAAPLPKKFNEDPLPPYPLILPAPPASGVSPSVLWTCEDLKVRRPDGYRLLPAPLLKGEYHQHVPAPGRVVQVQDRTYNCCEALLTEYIDFFSEPEVLSHMMAMLTQLQGNAAAQAKVVAQVEEQLFNAGYTTPAWNAQLRDVWVKSIAREGLNFKDVAMHLDALQYHIRTLDHRPTRLTFIRHMQSARCPLWTPQEGDLVVLMRTGCMVHLDKYAALAQYYNVDDITKAREMVQKLKPVEHFKVVAIGYRTYAATHKEGAVPMPKIEGQQQVKEEAKPDPLDPDVIAQGGPAAIQKLLAGIPGMPANAQIGAVVNVNGQQAVTVNGQLVGIAALIQLSKQVQQQQQAKAGPSTSQSGSGNGAEQAQGPLNKPGPATTVSPNRPGCMWMVLQHVQPDGTVAGGEGAQPQYAVVPLHIDTSLPDYLVRPDIYEQGMRKRWATGDRFRMYFGGKVGTKVGGMWYRGTVKAFVLSQGQPGEENYDPWESVIVQWDLDDGSSQTNVNPWEIEVDPEEAKRREEELRKAQHAAARAQRAEAKGRRSAEKLREILAQELGSEAEELESSSESESDITEDEDFDDDMPKRKYNRRKAPQRGGFNNANNRQQQQQQAQQQQLQAQVLATHQQHQQQQYALVQQLQRLQQVGQGNSAIAMQVMTALQNIQRAQQNLMMQHPAIFQQLAAQQQQRAGQPQGQQQQQQLQQQQMQQQQLQRQQQQGQGQQVHPHQQQIMQQAVARQGGQVMIAPGGQQQLLQQVQQQQQQQQQPQQIMLQPGSQQAQLYQQQQAQLQYQRQQQGMQQQQQQLLAQQGMMQGQGQVQLTPQQVQMLRQQQQAQLQAQQQGQYQQYQ